MNAQTIWQSAERYATEAAACEACRAMSVVHALAAIETALRTMRDAGRFRCRSPRTSDVINASYRHLPWLDGPRMRVIWRCRNHAIHQAQPITARDAGEWLAVCRAQIEAWKMAN